MITFPDLYKETGNYHELTERAKYRFAEIEIYMMYNRMVSFIASTKGKEKTLDYLIEVIDPHEELSYMQREKLRKNLDNPRILRPHQTEMVFFLRFHGIGLNKITRITKAQHYLFDQILREPSILIDSIAPVLQFDWKWDEYPKLIEATRYVATSLMNVTEPSFYDGLNMKFPKPEQLLKQQHQNAFHQGY